VPAPPNSGQVPSFKAPLNAFELTCCVHFQRRTPAALGIEQHRLLFPSVEQRFRHATVGQRGLSYRLPQHPYGNGIPPAFSPSFFFVTRQVRSQRDPWHRVPFFFNGPQINPLFPPILSELVFPPDYSSRFSHGNGGPPPVPMLSVRAASFSLHRGEPPARKGRRFRR